MNSAEIGAIVVGLILGYCAVAATFQHFGKRDGPRPDPQGYEDERPWHEVLGISGDASVAEIERARTALLAQNDPNSMHGLSPELLALARQRSVEIQRATDRALRDRSV